MTFLYAAGYLSAPPPIHLVWSDTPSCLSESLVPYLPRVPAASETTVYVSYMRIVLFITLPFHLHCWGLIRVDRSYLASNRVAPCLFWEG